MFDLYFEKKNDKVLTFKVGLSLPEKICVVCFIESPLKMMKNVSISS